MRYSCLAGALVALLSQVVTAEEARAPIPRQVVVPLQGLEAACCDKAVEKSLGAIGGVASVHVEKDAEGGKLAVIVLKDRAVLGFSDLSRSLDRASSEMKTTGMDVHYQVDGDRLRIGEDTALVIAQLDEGTIRNALIKSLDGVYGVMADSAQGGIRVRLRLAKGTSVSFAAIVDAIEEKGGKVADLVANPPSASTDGLERQVPPPAGGDEPPPAPRGGSGGGC